MSALIDSIKPEHLQYADNVGHYNLMSFLSSIDTDATNRKYREELRPIPPSYLGRKILELSRENLVQDSDPQFRYFTNILCLMGDDLETAQTKARRVVQTQKSGLFLWTAVRLAATLHAANSYECPYMPQSWIEQFFKEKKGLPSDLKKEYLGNILEQITPPLDMELLKTFHFAFHQLVIDAIENIVLIVGSFLEKTEESNVKESVKKWEKGMSPDVVKALKSIDF